MTGRMTSGGDAEYLERKDSVAVKGGVAHEEEGLKGFV